MIADSAEVQVQQSMNQSRRSSTPTVSCGFRIHAQFPAVDVESTLCDAHAGSRTRVTSMGGLYDTATLRALRDCDCRALPVITQKFVGVQ